ncbi:hypothetical protein ACFSC4_20730 [Deinococcus malanensis]|uniref:hypothetical protein n=1 Tax=Deinococcus malanensis TaxID=1706855 RepID=UPI00362FFAAA
MKSRLRLIYDKWTRLVTFNEENNGAVHREKCVGCGLADLEYANRAMVGNAFQAYPTALLEELNGPKRTDRLLELSRQGNIRS